MRHLDRGSNIYFYNIDDMDDMSKRAAPKGIVERPILSMDCGSLGQVDLINTQSLAKASHK